MKEHYICPYPRLPTRLTFCYSCLMHTIRPGPQVVEEERCKMEGERLVSALNQIDALLRENTQAPAERPVHHDPSDALPLCEPGPTSPLALHRRSLHISMWTRLAQRSASLLSVVGLPSVGKAAEINTLERVRWAAFFLFCACLMVTIVTTRTGRCVPWRPSQRDVRRNYNRFFCLKVVFCATWSNRRTSATPFPMMRSVLSLISRFHS
ncbi:hypothetical protein EDB89DRAFT_315790 [Lactarius sanguifluus]|nr:hypothetical protein EDB89DRAFT_315790 [Lactarius sanguifluus]